MRVPGFARLYAGLLLGRIGGGMMLVTLILFVLARYHSPQLAGVTAFFSVLPGVLVSPIAGALLDRHGRARLVVVDYAIAAVSVGLIAVLSTLNALPPPLLLAIVALASLTSPLSSAGARSLFPVLAPKELWERANALDSSGHLISTLVGPPLAGALVGLVGGEWALGAAAAVFGVAAVVMVALPDPEVAGSAQGSIVLNAWLGLKYVVRNATLRGLAISLSIQNLGFGVIEIALPVLVLERLHQGPAVVGLLWGSLGAAGLVSALIAGRFATEGRERHIMAGAMLINGLAIAILPLATGLVAVAVATTLMGLAGGPFDIALFTLRQKRTDPAWFGRAFAVSMSLNYSGSPIGSAFAGTLIGVSLNAALWVAVAITLVAAILPMILIPPGDGRSSGLSPRSR